MNAAHVVGAAIVGSLLLGATAAPGEVVGRVELLGADGRRSAAEGAVVWVPGLLPGGRSGAASSMASKEKRFDPHVIAVPAGATVRFPNLDRIFHNAFSQTPGSAFDLGLYRNGAERQMRFDAPGLVRVYCNIHAQMAGYVMVVDSGAFAVTDAHGGYRIAGVPEGPRTVRVWHEMAGETTAAVDVPAGRPAELNVQLDATSYKPTAHRNKYGEPYPPPSRDADRY